MANDNSRLRFLPNDDDESMSTQSTDVLGADFVHRPHQNKESVPSARERMKDVRNAPDIVLCVKLIMLGDFSVGKTSIVGRFIYDTFDDKCKPTVGVDFNDKTIRVYPNVLVRLRLWDLAGQERYHSISKSYYRNVQAVIIVDDYSSSPSNHRQTVSKWRKRFCDQFHDSSTSKKEDCVSIRDQLVNHQNNKTTKSALEFVPNSLKDVVFALAMNKCDAKNVLQTFESQKEDFDVVECTSAREDKNVDSLFLNVARACADRVFARMLAEGLSVTKSYAYEGEKLQNYWRIRMPRRDTRTKQLQQKQLHQQRETTTTTKECPCILL